MDVPLLRYVETVQGGFLGYEPTGPLADAAYSRLALHHLPHSWKAVALRRVRAALRPGGFFRLADIVWSFSPDEAEDRIEAWCASVDEASDAGDWTVA